MKTSHTQHSAPTRFIRGFIDHPASVDETYFQHARFALGFAGWLLLAAGAAVVHAIIPPLFESTASRIIRELNARLTARH